MISEYPKFINKMVNYLDRDIDFVPFSNQTWLVRKSPEPSDFFESMA